MTASKEQRRQFGERVQELRTNARLPSYEAVAELLAAEGISKTGATVEGWAKGRWAPSAREEVEALERVLGAPGQLLPLLGYSAGPAHDDRLTRLEAEFAEIKATVQQILARPPARKGRAPGGAKP